MANINNSTSTGLRSILEKEKLNTTNFNDWKRNLRIVLKQEKKLDVIEHPLPQMPEFPTEEEQKAYDVACDRSLDVACLMLATMSPELQKQFEEWEAYEMMKQLETIFATHARTERYETVKAILDCKLNKGEPIGPHVLKMKSLFDKLQRLNVEIGQQLAVDILLYSLHNGYDNFRLQYHMHSMEKSLTDLIGMLKTAEQSIPAEPAPKKEVLMVQKKKNGFKKSGKKGQKGKGKGKAKQGNGKQVAKSQAKPNSQAEHVCFYCNETGHWKRNCPKYLKDKKDG